MGNNVEQITLDFTGVKTLWELHERIRVAFDFPEWYGKNWDAFWDLLSEPRNETLVTVRGIKLLPEELQPSGKMVIKLLEDYKQYQTDYYEFTPETFCYKVIS